MGVFEQQPVVGLFGTCGDSTFRDDLFIPEYRRLGIDYFNPQLPPGTWTPEDAVVEADHLAYDVVQCWPVLGSTYGSGSLAEQGFSIASSLRSVSPLPKFVIAMIEMELSDTLTDEVARDESIRARKLAATHLARVESPNVLVVHSLEEMLATSVALFGVAQTLVEQARAKSPAVLRFIERQAHAQQMQEMLDAASGADLDSPSTGRHARVDDGRHARNDKC